MPRKRKKPVVRAWCAGPFTVVQVGRKAWQRVRDGCSFAADVFGDDWVETEFDAVRGPTFAKRRDNWIKSAEVHELPAREARRLDAQRRKATGGGK